jgi:hypothetical protein
VLFFSFETSCWRRAAWLFVSLLRMSVCQSVCVHLCRESPFPPPIERGERSFFLLLLLLLILHWSPPTRFPPALPSHGPSPTLPPRTQHSTTQHRTSTNVSPVGPTDPHARHDTTRAKYHTMSRSRPTQRRGAERSGVEWIQGAQRTCFVSRPREQRESGQNGAEHGRAEQSTAAQSRTGQGSTAGQSETEQEEVESSRMEPEYPAQTLIFVHTTVRIHMNLHLSLYITRSTTQLHGVAITVSHSYLNPNPPQRSTRFNITLSLTIYMQKTNRQFYAPYSTYSIQLTLVPRKGRNVSVPPRFSWSSSSSTTLPESKFTAKHVHG